MVTISEVAKRIGVSPATVSRVINNVDHPIKEETRQKVLAAVHELKFSSNIYAKGLSGRPNVIALCLGFSLSDDPGCAYSLAGITQGINTVARSLGYHVFLDTSLMPDDTLDDAILPGTLFAGAIVVSPRRNNPYVDFFTEKKIPFVILGSRQFSQSNFLDADNYSVGRRAVKYLSSIGRDRIGCLGGPADFNPSLDMVLGFRSMIKELGLLHRQEWIARDRWTVENGRRMALAMLKRPERPNAIFACTDFLALGALQAASELGISVPGDLSLVGYDDYSIATMVHPRLTTFRHPDCEMGMKSMKWLIEEIIPHPDDGNVYQELVMPELIIRDSCGGSQEMVVDEPPVKPPPGDIVMRTARKG